MSGRIPRQFIDDLLLRADIVDLIDTHVPLKKTGNNFVARCPFHTEKTPSFSVNRNRQIYHCFGCGASGNAISFLMDFSHLDFVEAVEDLAAFVGVEVPKEAADKSAYTAKADNARHYQLLAAVSAFYKEKLQSKDGRIAADYLQNRGVSAEIAAKYDLGFAPQSWDALAARFDQTLLLETGMLVAKEDGKSYDRFRNRLIFPIRDKRKRVIGFGGRVLDDSLPKYLNSPESATFSKSKELYGLCELLENHPRPKQILIVEGYMDVIALAQFGLDNAVAALGTATSKTHLDLLFRFTAELVFCFDGDQAGRQAAWKATETALPCLRDGRQIKIMLLPQGQDPDTLIRAEGLSAFQSRIETASVLSDYFFEQLGAPLNLATVEGRSQLLASAKPQLEKIPRGFFRDMMFARLRALTGARLADKTTPSPNRDKKNPFLPQTTRSNLIRRILSLLLQYPQLAKRIDAKSPLLDNINSPGSELLKAVLEVIDKQKPENSAILLECFRDSSHEKTVNALSNLSLETPENGVEIEFCDALKQLLNQARENRMGALIDKVNRGETLSQEEMEEYRRGGKT